MSKSNDLLRSVILALSVGLSAAPVMAAVPFAVTVQTPALTGSTGFLAFTLLAGSPGAGNDVLVSAFTSDAALGTGAGVGSFTGSLVPGPLRLNSATTFFNEWLQPITFGTQFSFEFGLDPGVAGLTPDNFSFYLLDAAQSPLPTTDPTGGGAAFSVDIGAVSTPQVYGSSLFTATVTVVPEPPAWLLIAAGLGLFRLLQQQRRLAGGR